MKKILTCFAVLFSFTLLIILLQFNSYGYVKVDKAASEYSGMHYKLVEEELIQLGFTNIVLNEIPNLKSSDELKDYDVGSIVIDGMNAFGEGVRFKKDSKVVINYHTIKKIALPIGCSEATNYSIEQLQQMLKQSGYTNVKVKTMNDLDKDSEEYRELVINKENDYQKDDFIPYDALITIMDHKHILEYNVVLKLIFNENLFFNKYGLDIELDKQAINTLAHGEDGSYTLLLANGEHTLTLFNNENKSLYQEVSFEVDCNMELAYVITCEEHRIKVEEQYIDKDQVVETHQAKITMSEADFKKMTLTQVIQQLKTSGFTNVKEEAIYDIVWGITPEESIQSVIIDGRQDYRRGEILNKDVEVIVRYHLDEDKDPNKLRLPFSLDVAKGMNYEEVKKALINEGFTNVECKTSSGLFYKKYQKDEVITIRINHFTMNYEKAYSPDSNIVIYYYDQETNDESNNQSVNEFDAISAFEEYGKALYPYGFQCHWITELKQKEKLQDGSWYLEVGVSVTNESKDKVKAIAKGIVAGTSSNPIVLEFDIKQ